MRNEPESFDELSCLKQGSERRFLCYKSSLFEVLSDTCTQNSLSAAPGFHIPRNFFMSKGGEEPTVYGLTEKTGNSNPLQITKAALSPRAFYSPER